MQTARSIRKLLRRDGKHGWTVRKPQGDASAAGNRRGTSDSSVTWGRLPDNQREVVRKQLLHTRDGDRPSYQCREISDTTGTCLCLITWEEPASIYGNAGAYRAHNTHLPARTLKGCVLHSPVVDVTSGLYLPHVSAAAPCPPHRHTFTASPPHSSACHRYPPRQQHLTTCSVQAKKQPRKSSHATVHSHWSVYNLCLSDWLIYFCPIRPFRRVSLFPI